MADLFRHAETALETYVQAFSAVPGQAGAIFALGGRAVGLEVLFSPDTFAKLLPKLIRSYALDAIEIPGDHSPLPPSDSAVSLLRQVAAADVRGIPGRRPGEDAATSDQRYRGGGPLGRGGTHPPGGVPQ